MVATNSTVPFIKALLQQAKTTTILADTIEKSNLNEFENPHPNTSCAFLFLIVWARRNHHVALMFVHYQHMATWTKSMLCEGLQGASEKSIFA